jgi:hypothetical protein
MTAAVIVLVFEAARKCVSVRGGFVMPSSVAPYPKTKLPSGVFRRTKAPGSRSSLPAPSTVAWSAAESIGLRAGLDAPITLLVEQATPTTMASILLIIGSLPGQVESRNRR